MKISVVTATFNSEKFIQRCIASVHSQSFGCEHIIVDGASSDATNHIVKKYLRPQDKHVIEPDRGIYDAFNKGISLASGDVIAILNSDDRFAHPSVLATIASYFDDDVDLVYGGTQYETKSGALGAVLMPDRYNGRGSFSRGWHPPHPSFYARKHCYQKAGEFRLDLPVAADFELMLRFFENFEFGSKLLPEVVVFMDPGGYSSTWSNRVRGFQDIKRAFQVNNCKPGSFYFLKRYSKKLLKRILL